MPRTSLHDAGPRQLLHGVFSLRLPCPAKLARQESSAAHKAAHGVTPSSRMKPVTNFQPLPIEIFRPGRCRMARARRILASAGVVPPYLGRNIPVCLACSSNPAPQLVPQETFLAPGLKIKTLPTRPENSSQPASAPLISAVPIIASRIPGIGSMRIHR